jgi:hypothetical protein
MPLLGSNDKCNNSHQNSGEYRSLCGVPRIWSGSGAASYFDIFGANRFACIIGEKLWFSPGSSASGPSICNIIHPGVRTVPKVGVYTSRLGLIVGFEWKLTESILVFGVGNRRRQRNTWIGTAGEFEWICISTWRWKCCGAASSVEDDNGARGNVVARETVENRRGGCIVAAASVSETKWNWSSLTSGFNGVDSYWGGGTGSVGEVVLGYICSLAEYQGEEEKEESVANHVELWVGKQSGLDNVDKKYLLQQPIIISFSLVHLFSRSSLKGGSIFQRDVLFQ